MANAYIERGPITEALGDHDITDLYLAFVDAFSAYRPAVKLSLIEFKRKFFEFYRTDKDYSPVIIFDNAIAGFGLTTYGIYEGKKAAWVSALGIRPAYRGRGWSHFLIRELVETARSSGLWSMLLEVQTHNDPAVSLFSAYGFVIRRKLFSYRRVRLGSATSYPWTVRSFDRLKIPFDQADNARLPAFGETMEFIENEKKNHITLLVYDVDDQPTGFLLMDSDTGRIRHIFVKKRLRRQKFGSALMDAAVQKHEGINMINVDEGFPHQFLEYHGFRQEQEQYEMILRL